MIIVRMQGGLGNQMFIYAYGKALEKRGYQVKFDLSTYEKYKKHGGYWLDRYPIKLQASTKAERKRFFSRSLIYCILGKLGLKAQAIMQEHSLVFNEDFLTPPDNHFIDGYFQNERYFKEIASELRQDFTLDITPFAFTQKIAQQIRHTPNSCSLHIRRGDYISKEYIDTHGATALDYYHQAVAQMEQKKGTQHYFIFSDDISWCRENLTFIKNATFVDSLNPRIPQEDMYLMSLCQNHIIANSTYSWWGAYLNPNPNKRVIAPKKWFTSNELQQQSAGIVCEDWEKL